MPYGINIKNKWGNTVIDDSSASVQKLRSGTIQPISYNQDWRHPYGHTTRCFHIKRTPNSLLFMQPAIGQYVSAPMQMQDYTASDGDNHRIYSNSTMPIPFFEALVSEEITGIPRQSWGLEIKDADGKIKFHSGAELVAIDDHYVLDGWSGSGSNANNPYRELTVVSNDWICPMTPTGWAGFQRINGVTEGDMYHAVSAMARIAGGKVAWRPLTYRRTKTGPGASSYSYAGISFFTA